MGPPHTSTCLHTYRLSGLSRPPHTRAHNLPCNPPHAHCLHPGGLAENPGRTLDLSLISLTGAISFTHARLRIQSALGPMLARLCCGTRLLSSSMMFRLSMPQLGHV